MSEATDDLRLSRQCIIEWQDPSVAARGLNVPPAPLAHLIGFRCVKAEAGEIVMELQPEESLENTIGALLPSDMRTATLDLKLTFLKPLTATPGSIRAVGRATDIAGRIGYAQAEVVDEAGNFADRVVRMFAVIGSQQKSLVVEDIKATKQHIWSAFRDWLAIASG